MGWKETLSLSISFGWELIKFYMYQKIMNEASLFVGQPQAPLITLLFSTSPVNNGMLF